MVKIIDERKVGEGGEHSILAPTIL